MDAKSNSSVERALNLLELVASRNGGITLAEIEKHVDIPKSTAHRLLETLHHRGYVEWDSRSATYSIGLKMLETGVSGLIHLGIVNAAIPYLNDITEQTGETTFLAVPDHHEIVYLYKLEGEHSVAIRAHLGARRPMYRTGLGKAILSAMPRDEAEKMIDVTISKMEEPGSLNRDEMVQELELYRKQGWAIFDSNMITGYAVPLYNYTGKVIGAISCIGSTDRMKANQDRIIPLLMNNGEQISRRVGYVPSLKYWN